MPPLNLALNISAQETLARISLEMVGVAGTQPLQLPKQLAQKDYALMTLQAQLMQLAKHFNIVALRMALDA